MKKDDISEAEITVDWTYEAQEYSICHEVIAELNEYDQWECSECGRACDIYRK